MFLKTNKAVLALVMCSDTFAKLEVAEGRWGQSNNELESVVLESGIGAKLFGRAVMASKSEAVQTKINEIVSGLPERLTEALVSEAHAKVN